MIVTYFLSTADWNEIKKCTETYSPSEISLDGYVSPTIKVTDLEIEDGYYQSKQEFGTECADCQTFCAQRCRFQSRGTLTKVKKEKIEKTDLSKFVKLPQDQIDELVKKYCNADLTIPTSWGVILPKSEVNFK